MKIRWPLVGLAALAIVVGAGSGIIVYDIETAQIDNETTSGYQPARAARLGLPPEDRVKAPHAYEPHCESPKSREDADLCAQWSSVETSEQANRLSTAALRVTAFEFGALVLSLFFTGWAAIAAGKAARIAEESTRITEAALDIARRNADAAAEQVEVARSTAVRQLRAYVDIEGVDLILESTALAGPFDYLLQLRLHNFGQTPAEIEEIVWTANLRKAMLANMTAPAPFPEGWNSRIPPDHTLNWAGHFTLDLDDHLDVVNGRDMLVAHGSLIWTDAFGGRERITLEYETEGNDYNKQRLRTVSVHRALLENA